MELDQAGNAEGCPIVQVRTFQAHCVLTDRGELTLESLGEGTAAEMVSRAYPLLEKTLSDAYGDADDDSDETLPPIHRATIGKAVEAERARIAYDHPRAAEPHTELGRDVKKQMAGNARTTNTRANTAERQGFMAVLLLLVRRMAGLYAKAGPASAFAKATADKQAGHYVRQAIQRAGSVARWVGALNVALPLRNTSEGAVGAIAGAPPPQ